MHSRDCGDPRDMLQRALTRRQLLAWTAASVAVLAGCGDDGASTVLSTVTRSAADEPVGTPGADAAITLDQFIQLSRVLTAFPDLNDDDAGAQYLEAHAADPALGRLWEQAGFGTNAPPATVDDLAARGIYDDPALAALADAVTGDWYSGTYAAPAGDVRVATYINALAWRSLGYRQTGPSSCGGAFGHWNSNPSAG